MRLIFFFLFANVVLFAQDHISAFRKIEKQVRYQDIEDLPKQVEDLHIKLPQGLIYQKWSKGLVFYYHSDFFNSFVYLDEAHKLALKTKDRFLISEIELDLGQTLLVNNEVSLALTHLLNVKDFFLKHGSNNQKARVLITLGELFRKSSQHDKAFQSLRQSDPFIDGDFELMARYYNRIAAIKYEEQKPDSSIYYSKKALKFADKANNIELRAISENEIAAVLQNGDGKDLSLKRFKRVEELWRSIHNLRYAMDARIRQLEIYHLYKIHTKEVLKFALDTQKEIEGKKWYDVELHTNDLIHEIYFDFKEYEKADFYLKRYCKSQLDLLTQRNAYTSIIAERLYAFEKTQKIVNEQKLSLENQQLKVLATKKEQQKLTWILVSISLILLFILIMTFVQVKRKKQLRIDKNNLEKINDELGISILKNNALIQEIHHRVKNNLQSISILVEMQLKQDKEKDNNALQATHRRITAMVLVHEMLYKHENLSSIPTDHYFKNLLAYLSEMFYDSQRTIQFETDLQGFNMNVTQSMALGIITNEIISNSVKHVSEKNLHIFMSLKNTNDDIVFKIKDNGKPSNEQSTPQNLGSKLIEIFVKQLKAKMELTKENGYEYTFYFKHQ